MKKYDISELNLQLKVACEIEFYLIPMLYSESEENRFQEKILTELSDSGIQIWEFQNEVAPSQFEVSLQPQQPDIAISQLNKLKDILRKTAKEFGTEAIFEAKPDKNKPGCGLHIHIGINDMDGNSVLTRKGVDISVASLPRAVQYDEGSPATPAQQIPDFEESDIMLWAIGGLCSTMLKNFIYFAPTEASYARFSTKRNDAPSDNNPLAAYNNAPVNVSWGGNNRTTAIRIPVSTVDESARHIEHRVAGADADAEQVINAIIEGIYSGIKNRITPPEKIYGNAFDKQYDFLEPFPKTLKEAKVYN